MAESNAREIIEKDNLMPHPEGGYYIRTYQSNIKVEVPARYTGESTRPESTKINYLLVENDFSAWHRIKSDEIFRFKKGTSLTLHIIDKNGNLNQVKIGDPLKEPDAVREFRVEHSQWFSASVNDKTSFSYVECEVRPGFMFNDFELATQENLLEHYPEHGDIIQEYSIKGKVEIPDESHSSISLHRVLNDE